MTILAAALTPPALAGGARLYETSAGDIALASAGYVARAQDSSTVYSNPAGMCRLEPGSDILLSIQPLFGNVSLSPNEASTVDGNDGGNALGAFPGGSAFYAGGGERLKWGVGFVGNFGLGLAYQDGWVGRYYVEDTTLLGLTLAPSVAYRLSETVSIGGSLHAMYGVFDLSVAVNNLLPGSEDGRLGFNDKTWGLGARLGVLVEPAARTRIGVVYQSKIDLDFEGRADFENLGPLMTLTLELADLVDADLNLSMQVPQAIMASLYQDYGDWAVMGNVGWEDWSEFGKVGVVVSSDDPESLTVDRSYEDTWHLALGAQRRLSAWTISFGAAWDSSVVQDEDRTVDLPLGPSLRLGVGGTKRLSGRGPEMTFSYELVWSGDLAVDQFRGPLSGRVAGEYEGAAIHFFGASFRWGQREAS
jgi:long-chain fatty acid transport protein